MANYGQSNVCFISLWICINNIENEDAIFLKMSMPSRLSSDNKFTFVCVCGLTKELEIPSRRTKVKVTCRCGEKTSVTLDGRKTYRKSTLISALFNGAKVTIEDVSENGYRMTCSRPLMIKKKHLYSLQYTLPDKQRTEVNELVEVVRKKGKEYGLRAEEKPYSKSQRAKGFWLRP